MAFHFSPIFAHLNLSPLSPLIHDEYRLLPSTIDKSSVQPYYLAFSLIDYYSLTSNSKQWCPPNMDLALVCIKKFESPEQLWSFLTTKDSDKILPILSSCSEFKTLLRNQTFFNLNSLINPFSSSYLSQLLKSRISTFDLPLLKTLLCNDLHYIVERLRLTPEDLAILKIPLTHSLYSLTLQDTHDNDPISSTFRHHKLLFSLFNQPPPYDLHYWINLLSFYHTL